MKDTRDIKDTSGLKPITDIQEVQQIERGILERVAAFCEERGICYSLYGGTLLGAIRHKGFIPWDNDVDIFMPRPDYERFCKEFSAEGLSLHCFEKQKDWHYPFAKIFDDKTGLVEDLCPDFEIALHIDVFPMDGFPSVKIASRTLRKRSFLHTASYVKEHTKWNKPNRPIYKTLAVWLFKTVCLLLPKYYFSFALKKSLTRYGWEGQPYVANLTWTHYDIREAMPRSCVDTFVDVEFEGRKYKAIAGWDTYLSNIFGDYMTLPPEEDRWVHPIKAWWK